MKVALQMYSLHEYTNEDFLGTLKKVAQMGYDGVEFAGFFGVSAKDLKKYMEELNLIPMGAHISIEELTENLDSQIEYARELGLYSVTCPCVHSDTYEGWVNLGKTLNDIGKRFMAEGIIFSYHNHAHEFKKFNDKYALDLIYENSDPNNLGAEIDTYWVKKGNEDPVSYTKKYKNRSFLLHAKDMFEDGQDSNIGCGIIDFKTITSALPKLEWVIVEQESYNGDPFECLKEGCDNLKNL